MHLSLGGRAGVGQVHLNLGRERACVAKTDWSSQWMVWYDAEDWDGLGFFSHRDMGLPSACSKEAEAAPSVHLQDHSP